jgi:hypothetical protein
MTMIPPGTSFTTRPNFPYLVEPYSNGTPFTYRDAMTYLRRLETFAKYINSDLLPWVDEGFAQYITAFNVALADIAKYMEGQQVVIDGKLVGFSDLADKVDKTWNDVIDAKEGVDAARDAVYAITYPSPGANVDISADLQRLYDEGVRTVTLVSGQTYYWSGTLFLDNGNVRDRFFFRQNGATVVAMDGAGSLATPYAGTAGTRFLVFVNTKRSAKVGQTVTVSEATSATGSYTATVGAGLVWVDADVRGANGGQLARIAMVNNSSVKFVSGTTSYLNGFYATAGYTDSNYPSDVRVTNPFGDASGIAEQQSNGDALVVTGNADARSMIANIRYNRGSIFQAPVGGSIKIVDSRAVNIIGAHIEGDEKLRPVAPLRVTRSLVNVMGCEFWVPTTAKAFAAIEVVDGSANANGPTDLYLENVLFMNVFRPDWSVADERSNPEIKITSMNAGSTIRARNVWSSYTVVTATDLWRVAPVIVSDDAAIQTAINNGAAIIATGSWDLKKIGNSWRVTPPNSNLIEVIGITTAPAIDTAGSNSEVLGTIAAGDYSYYFAMIDGNGIYGNRGATTNVTLASASGNTARIIATPPRPGRMAIWRKGSAQATPDRYAVFGVGSAKVFLFDTGDNINKRAWNRDNVPAMPDSVGSLSVDTLRFNGKVIL